jgi:hypothetical protein
VASGSCQIQVAESGLRVDLKEKRKRKRQFTPDRSTDLGKKF